MNAVVRGYIERYAQHAREQAALWQLLDLAARSNASSGSSGRTWTRDDLHHR